MNCCSTARCLAFLSPLFWIGNVSAIIAPCSLTGATVFWPGHPGPSDPIGYSVDIDDASPQLQGPPVIFSTVVVGSGNQIEIDVIVATSAASFPGYQIAEPFSYDNTFGFFGPLPVGAYSVSSTVNSYDPQTGMIQPACPPKMTTLTVTPEPGPTANALVVEFYNSQLDHYFLTQFGPEISSLDAGTKWKRTGQSFLAYLPGQSDGRGRPVARYYGLPTAGLDSHFFTWNYTERNAVENGPFSGAWELETYDAFETEIPDWPSGLCPPNTIPVYRLWNARPDSDHRYTTDVSIKQAMISQGYVPEGYGPDAVVMCALAP